MKSMFHSQDSNENAPCLTVIKGVLQAMEVDQDLSEKLDLLTAEEGEVVGRMFRDLLQDEIKHILFIFDTYRKMNTTPSIPYS